MAKQFRILQATPRRMLYDKGLQDGAPAHFTNAMRAYVSRKFGGQWTARGGPVFLSPRSPDLFPIGFFV